MMKKIIPPQICANPKCKKEFKNLWNLPQKKYCSNTCAREIALSKTIARIAEEKKKKMLEKHN